MRVALTIDAEPPDQPTDDPVGGAERIIELLADRDVRATFFVQDRWAAAFPHVLQRVRDGGHLVGSHSHWHCIFTSMTREGMLDDLARSRHSLTAVGIDAADWFRLPGGEGSGDDGILEVLGAGGFRHVHWTVISDDTTPGRSAEQVAANIGADVDSRRPNGLSVPLLHSWPDVTPMALERTLDLLAESVQFVRLDQVDLADIRRTCGLRFDGERRSRRPIRVQGETFQ